MKKTFTTKPIINKKNKQINISIPKSKIKEFKHKVPVEIKFRIEKIRWQKK